jgi:hypothetical protein
VREQHINGGGTMIRQDAERECMEAIAFALACCSGRDTTWDELACTAATVATRTITIDIEVA